jgi:hypothetical protein
MDDSDGVDVERVDRRLARSALVLRECAVAVQQAHPLQRWQFRQAGEMDCESPTIGQT